MYLKGIGVEKDNQKGLSLIIKAAESHDLACIKLFIMYTVGDSVKKIMIKQ